MALPTRISFFGIGCRVLVGTFNDNEWAILNSVANELNLPLSSAIFDPSFYIVIGDESISNLIKLGNKLNVYGLLNTYESVIQIQVYRKRRRSIKLKQILNSNTLFPLYNFNEDKINIGLEENSLIVVEKEIGQIARFKVTEPTFNLEELLFNISSVNLAGSKTQFDLITGINYKNTNVPSIGCNCLVREQSAFVNDRFNKRLGLIMA